MAVQQARLAQTAVRSLPAAPRVVRQPRPAAASTRAPARMVAAHGRAAALPARAVATAPWAGVGPRVRPRLRPAALVLSGIIVATMVGLVYVTQVLAAQNARYAVDRLLVERQALMRTLGSQEAAIVQWGSEVRVTGEAQRGGLDQLGISVRVRAR